MSGLASPYTKRLILEGWKDTQLMAKVIDIDSRRRFPPDLLFEADPFWDGDGARAASIPCSVCNVDSGEPCFDSISQGLPGFHYVRLRDAERG